MGWHEDAYSRFDQLCCHIKYQWETSKSKHLELTFQQRATVEYATMGDGTRGRSQQTEPTMMVFNELASGSNDVGTV